MPMTLGDFFTTAPHARPVNPKPVQFTICARGRVLPGGAANPHGVPVLTTVTAAFVFLGGDGAERARIEARQSLRKRFVDDNGLALETDGIDLGIETVYHELWRVLYQWDDQNKRVGERLFESVDLLRELLEPSEANRVYRAYNTYVDEEHPEVVDAATFRGAKEGSGDVAGKSPRR